MRKRSRVRYAMAIGLAMLVSVPVLAQSLPEWRLTRNLRIDAGEQDLSPVSWLTVSPNGTIVVNQGQDGLVRFFDARGAHLGPFGRKGQGPGEFETASGSGWIGDTLWVGDINTRRFTLVSPDRKLLRTVPWFTAATITGTLPGMAVADISSVFARGLGVDGSQLLSTNMKNEGVPRGTPSPVPMVRADRTGRLDRLIGLRPAVDCYASTAIGRGGFMTAVIPFCAGVLEDVSPDGGRYATALVEPSGRANYRVTVMRTSGDTAFSRSYPYQTVPLPRERFDSVIARRTARGQAEAIALWRGMKPPALYPPLAGVVLGRDETAWLEEYTVDGNRRWVVLDARGEAIARVTVPRAVRIMVASREAVWGTETDEDGLQHIVRYSIAPRP